MERHPDDLTEILEGVELSSLHETNPALDKALALLAKRSLAAFVQMAWQAVEPGTPYQYNWHIGAMCEHLEAVTAGKIKRLVINVPPGASKSRTVTVMWPCWEWIQKPNLRYLCASYAESLATDHNVERRAIIESEWYQRHWGEEVKLADDDNQKKQFTNTKKGRMMICGVGGVATGRGGERLICDDPLNPKQAASEAEIKNTKTWFRRTFVSRLRDKKNGAIVIVMQRLHEEDTSGIALKLGYDSLVIPAEFVPGLNKENKIGWKDPRGQKGEPMWPAREGLEELEALKRALGTFAYSGQYQQSPHPEGGGQFKREHFRYYVMDQMPGVLRYGAHSISIREMRKWTTIDPAFSKKETADYAAIGVWGFARGFLWLLDHVRDRLTEKEMAEELKRLQDRWGFYRNWIEKGAYKRGVGLIKYLRDNGISVSPFTEEHGCLVDKETRAWDATPRFEEHKVLFPQYAPWLHELEGELLKFPNGSYDDRVDMTSYAVLVAPWGSASAVTFEKKKRSDVLDNLYKPSGWE